MNLQDVCERLEAVIPIRSAVVAALTDNSGGATADGTIAAVTAPTALTDSTSGTANGTLEAMANPTDSPATADALRDDLVANLLPVIRNNFADVAARQAENRAAIVALTNAATELATKVNEILTALKNANLMHTS